MDSSTHALLLTGHAEAGGDGQAMVARVEQLLAASTPPRTLDAHECMDTWQRLGLELPEVRPDIPVPRIQIACGTVTPSNTELDRTLCSRTVGEGRAGNETARRRLGWLTCAPPRASPLSFLVE